MVDLCNRFVIKYRNLNNYVEALIKGIFDKSITEEGKDKLVYLRDNNLLQIKLCSNDPLNDEDCLLGSFGTDKKRSLCCYQGCYKKELGNYWDKNGR